MLVFFTKLRLREFEVRYLASRNYFRKIKHPVIGRFIKSGLFEKKVLSIKNALSMSPERALFQEYFDSILSFWINKEVHIRKRYKLIFLTDFPF